MAEWKDIESAPKDGSEFIGMNQNWSSEQRCKFVCDDIGDGKFAEYFQFCEPLISAFEAEADPTHWTPIQPLPELPKDRA